MPYIRSEEHTSELQSHSHLVCRLLLEKKKNKKQTDTIVNRNYSSIARIESSILRPVPTLLMFAFALSYFRLLLFFFFFFFFNDTATTEIYTLSLHDALPI